MVMSTSVRLAPSKLASSIEQRASVAKSSQACPKSALSSSAPSSLLRFAFTRRSLASGSATPVASHSVRSASSSAAPARSAPIREVAHRFARRRFVLRKLAPSSLDPASDCPERSRPWRSADSRSRFSSDCPAVMRASICRLGSSSRVSCRGSDGRTRGGRLGGSGRVGWGIGAVSGACEGGTTGAAWITAGCSSRPWGIASTQIS